VAHGAADFLLQLRQLVASLLEGFQEARDFRPDLFLPDRDAEDRGLPAFDDDRTADGDAGRSGDALVGADVVARLRAEVEGAVGEHKKLPVAGYQLPAALRSGNR